LHLQARPIVAYWRYEARKDSGQKHLVSTLGIDALTLPSRPSPKVPRQRQTTSHCPTRPEPFEIKPRFKWGDFEAISYCWGLGVREKSVVVDGVLVRISTNLEAILQKLCNLPEADSGMGFKCANRSALLVEVRNLTSGRHCTYEGCYHAGGRHIVRRLVFPMEKHGGLRLL